MKQIITILLLAAAMPLFSQGIVGGSGVCFVNGDPNLIASIATASNQTCKEAINSMTGERWWLDDTQPTGQKWILKTNSRVFIRTLPNFLNRAVKIGTYTNTSAYQGTQTIKVNISAAVAKISKSYIITLSPTNGSTAYTFIDPIMSGLASTTDDFQLVCRNVGTNDFELYLMRSINSGANIDCIVTLESNGLGEIFIPSNITTVALNITRRFWQYVPTMNNITSYTASFAATYDDATILYKGTAAGTCTLPPAANCKGKIYNITNLSAFVLTFNVPFRIGVSTTGTSLAVNACLSIQSDGTQYVKIR
jgi:hypothetical protein